MANNRVLVGIVLSIGSLLPVGSAPAAASPPMFECQAFEPWFWYEDTPFGAWWVWSDFGVACATNTNAYPPPQAMSAVGWIMATPAGTYHEGTANCSTATSAECWYVHGYTDRVLWDPFAPLACVKAYSWGWVERSTWFEAKKSNTGPGCVTCPLGDECTSPQPAAVKDE